MLELISLSLLFILFVSNWFNSSFNFLYSLSYSFILFLVSLFSFSNFSTCSSKYLICSINSRFSFSEFLLSPAKLLILFLAIFSDSWKSLISSSSALSSPSNSSISSSSFPSSSSLLLISISPLLFLIFCFNLSTCSSKIFILASNTLISLLSISWLILFSNSFPNLLIISINSIFFLVGETINTSSLDTLYIEFFFCFSYEIF